MTAGPNAEIDIVGNVLNCGPSKYAGHSQNMCREVTIADAQRNQFLLTLWDDIREIERAELEAQMEKGKEFAIFFERNIRISGYQVLCARMSGCKQKKCTKDKKQFDYAKCQRKTSLVPRCTFYIYLIDGSGSTTVFIYGDLAEELLSREA
ncbi:hypothetical protein RDI58_029207 [Solanum bulbocastanum]|uniref:Uncharacterized protein n=1 Tax=Solanum bulbocastanum TaxID=147425 RepID=A0AAN8Y1W4_SOLBU